MFQASEAPSAGAVTSGISGGLIAAVITLFAIVLVPFAWYRYGSEERTRRHLPNFTALYIFLVCILVGIGVMSQWQFETSTPYLWLASASVWVAGLTLRLCVIWVNNWPDPLGEYTPPGQQQISDDERLKQLARAIKFELVCAAIIMGAFVAVWILMFNIRPLDSFEYFAGGEVYLAFMAGLVAAIGLDFAAAALSRHLEKRAATKAKEEEEAAEQARLAAEEAERDKIVAAESAKSFGNLQVIEPVRTIKTDTSALPSEEQILAAAQNEYTRLLLVADLQKTAPGRLLIDKYNLTAKP